MQDKDRFVDDTLWVKQKKQQYKMSSDIYTSTQLKMDNIRIQEQVEDAE